MRFSHIASLHSELVAVTTDGYLHQWLWNDPIAPVPQKEKHCHNRASFLNLTDTEKVTKISAWNIRASIVTESGKVFPLFF